MRDVDHGPAFVVNHRRRAGARDVPASRADRPCRYCYRPLSASETGDECSKGLGCSKWRPTGGAP